MEGDPPSEIKPKQGVFDVIRKSRPSASLSPRRNGIIIDSLPQGDC